MATFLKINDFFKDKRLYEVTWHAFWDKVTGITKVNVMGFYGNPNFNQFKKNNVLSVL